MLNVRLACGLLVRSSVVAVLAAPLLLVSPAHAADALNYFRNYFVTGDSVVGSVGLRGAPSVNGFSTGTINISGVPCTSGLAAPAGIVPCSNAGALQAEIIAAYLYWETEESATTPSAMNGTFDGHAIVGQVVGNPNNPSCFSSGGTNGSSQVSGRVYRSDVRRYLPIDPTSNFHVGNGAHTVSLLNSGLNGNGNVMLTDGAALVLVYRVVVRGNPRVAPLRSVVIYDGTYTLAKFSAAFTQTVGGFYQAGDGSNPNTALARIIPIAGAGQLGDKSTLTVTPNNGSAQIFQDQFTGNGGTVARWDSPTIPINLPTNAASYSAQVTTGDNQTCLTFIALVTSTVVADFDYDGLLDVWETSGIHFNPGDATHPATFGACADYPLEPCVNLPAMGALKGTQDIFVQVDWMHGNGDGSGGINGQGFHVHVPSLGALSAVAGSFANHSIALHFDVGNNYQPAQVNPATGSVYGNLPFIVPAAYAQGGADIDESTLLCQNLQTTTCNYIEPYPVLGFKNGFALVRDGNPALGLPQHFPLNRKDAFHYLVMGHALAGPFDPTTGKPMSKDPRSVSGKADPPGGDIFVTLGLWRSGIPANDQVGSPLIQGGTIMHELGHNLGLLHGGLKTTPNCMVTYPSVMSYLYQTRGMTDLAGSEHIDYSNGYLTNSLSESSLSGALVGPSLQYRVRYYGPLGADNTPSQAAKAHCDGTPITDGALEIRSETQTVVTPDWTNGTVVAPNSIPAIDVNFDGNTNETFTDQPDWASLNLQQIGGKLNFGGFSAGADFLDGPGADFTDGPGADFLDGPGADFLDGPGADFLDGPGSVDIDSDLNSSAGLPATVPTPDCPTCGLTATGDFVQINLRWTAVDGPVDHYTIYRCVAPCSPNPKTDLRLPLVPATRLTTTNPVNDFNFADSGANCPAGNTCYNTTFTFAVTATSTTNTETGLSNAANGIVKHLFITAPTLSQMYGAPIPSFTPTIAGLDPGLQGNTTCSTTATPFSPVGVYPITCSGQTPAAGVTYIDGTLTITQAAVTVTADAKQKIYGTPDPALTYRITAGALLNGDTLSGSLTRTAGENVGTYAIRQGTLTAGANYILSFIGANLTINPAPITVAADAKQKTYGTPDPALTYRVTSGALVSGDRFSGSLTRVPGENAGIYAIQQGTLTAGNNYILTFIGANLTILPAPQTITFGPLVAQVYGNPPFAVNATASSGLPVSFTASGNCTVSGNIVALTAPGTCNVTASQSGNNNYLPATPVTQSFHIFGFVATGSMGTPRSSHTTTLLGSGQALVTGGLSGSALSTALNTAELYDPASGTFKSTGSLAAARSYHTATLIGGASVNAGKVLVVGGFNSSGAPLASAELFNPATGTFSSTTNNMPNKAAGHTATWIPTINKVLVVGGGNASSQIYDPAANAWSSAGGTGNQLTYHTATWIPSIGKVLIAGGSNTNGATTNVALLYDPATGAYTNTGSMTVSRDFHTAVLLTSGPNAGKVLIAGGRTSSSKGYTYLSSAELYDPATGTFTATGSLTSARQYFTGMVFSGTVANPLPGGPTVVEAGGIGGTAAVPTRLAGTEQYPASAFQPFSSMTAARGGHTATPIADGTVLVVGGQGSSGAPIASAEVLQ